MSDNWEATVPAIFAECVSKSTARYNLERPFLHGDYIYATNGRIIVRAPKEMCPEFVNKAAGGTGTYPNPDGLFVDGQHRSAAVKLPDVSHMADDEECLICRGSGYHIYSTCDNEHPCGGCSGFGRNETKFAIPIPSGPKPIRMQFVKLLKKHNATVYPPIDPKRPYRFVTAGGCEGLVMSMEVQQ